MKSVVAAFNQEKALVGAFSVIVKTDCGTDGSFHSTSYRGQVIRGDRGERSGGSAIVPAMRSDAGGYQEDTATQPPPPAQGYWRPAGAGAGLPADAEAACCCCAGLVLCWGCAG